MQEDANKPGQPNPAQVDTLYGAFLNFSGHTVIILEAIADGQDFVIADVNPADRRFTNRHREEMIGRRISDAYPQSANSKLLQLIHEVWKNGEPIRFDPIFYQDEHLYVWVKGYICKLPGNRIIVVCEDVTDDKRRHQQQEVELSIFSQLRNTDQLSRIIPEILTQIKAHTLATLVCVYLLPEFQSDIRPPNECLWTHCDNEPCLGKACCKKYGSLYWPHQKVLEGATDPSLSFFTSDGSFWARDIDNLKKNSDFLNICQDTQILPDRIKSGCIVALRSGEEIIGILQVMSETPHAFDESHVEFLEIVGASIGMAIWHHHVETKLCINENKVRSILDSMPAMLDAFDSDGNIIYWNKECERVTGYLADEVIGNPNIMHQLYPDEKYRAWVMETAKNNSEDFKDIEFTLTDKNGNPRIISWSNSSNTMPVEGWHLWAIGQDVTHIKKTDRALQGVLKGTARETGTLFFRNLTKNLAQTLGVKYAMIAEVLPNTPEACGTRAVWAGDHFGDNFIYHLEDTPSTEVSNGSRCIFAHNSAHLFPKDPLLVEMDVKSYADIHLLDAENKVLGILAVMDTEPLRDTKLISSILQIFSARAASELERQHAVEEQQRLEAQLRQSQKMEAIGQLAGGIAHDFNNLLQAISGYTELAMLSLNPENSARNDLKEVQRAAERAGGLVKQLLSFSSRQVLHPQVLDVNEVVNGTYNMIRRVIGEQIDFEFKQNPDIQPIRADRGQLDLIIINLCVNARDAMPNGGKLSINTFPFRVDEHYSQIHTEALPGNYTGIRVTDTGIGMPTKIKDHIFEPFFSTKGVGKGTGLGLSTVFGIVAQHKGFIRVESAPSAGTTIDIYLPSTGSESDSVKETAAASLGEKGNGQTILFAEDEEVVRNLGTTILKKAGYKVLAASDGEQAIELFHQYKDEISFAVLDVVMPNKSGPEVCKIIKASRPDLPILFATGYSFNLLENEIPHSGCEIISKPFSPQKLLKTISDMLAEATPPE